MKAWRLSWLRFSRRATGLGGVVLLIAAVQGVLVLVFSAQPVVESQAVAERMAALPSGSQWLSVTTSDAQATPTALHDLALRTLRQLSGRAIFQHLTYGPQSDLHSGRYQLLASDALPREVSIASGRLPNSCRPARCEVVLVGPANFRAPAGLDIVGHARLDHDSAIGLGIELGTPLLIAADPSALASRPTLRAVPHTLSWSTRIDASIISVTGISAYIDRVVRAADDITLHNGQLQLVAPTTQLAATSAQVQALQRRMLGLALCLVFVIVFSAYRMALATRREHDSLLLLTRQFGWSRGRNARSSAALAALVVVSGGLLGTVWGSAASLLAFGQLSAAYGVLWAWSALLLMSSLVAVTAGLSWQRTARAIAVTLACGVWAIIAWLGQYDAEVLLLACVGGAVALLVPALLRHVPVQPFTRNLLRANAARLTALTVIAGFLTGFVMAATASLATLRQGTLDHALFQSPLATRVTWGDRLPLQDHTLADYATMSGGGTAFPVRTVTTTIRQSVVEDIPAQLIGVDPTVWSRVPDLSGQTGISNANLARAVRAPVRHVGVALDGIQRLSGRVQGLDANVEMSLWILNNRDESVQLPVQVPTNGRFSLALPRMTVSLLGFALAESADAMAHRAHAVGEGRNTLAAPTGTLLVGELARDGRPLDIRSALPPGGTAQATSSNSLRWPYALVGGQAWASLVLPPRQVRAVVDPLTATMVRNGVLAVRLTDSAVVPITVAAVAKRLPTVAQRFILVDPSALDALLGAHSPETLRVSEIWITKPLLAHVAQSDALVGLTVMSRSGLQALSAASSASAWSTRTFDLLALVVLLVFVGFVIAVVREVLGTADLEAWAAQGLSTSAMLRTLRRVVVGLSTAAALLALIGLLTLFPTVLSWSNIDITGNPAVPPLAPVADLGQQLLVLLLTAALAWGSARSATSTRWQPSRWKGVQS